MKTFMCGLVTSIGLTASVAAADPVVTIDGKNYFLSHLTEKCQSITNDPAAQIACFNELSQYLEKQTVEAPPSDQVIRQAFDDLRAVAEYQDGESGLLIAGSGCTFRTVYYNNYFHISRRNISSIDLFSAEFDASKFKYEQTVQIQGAKAPLLKGIMESGTNAAIRGGVAMESSQHNFPPRSPGMEIDVYAKEVVNKLPGSEAQEFEFVLFHPQRNEARNDIWSAFVSYVTLCTTNPTAQNGTDSS